MIPALTGPFIPAKGYSAGRNSGAVIYLGIHTAEGATTRESLGSYFAGTTKGSSNAGMDERGVGGYAEYVRYADTPWTNPPINSRSDTLEICGFAHWTAQEWGSKPVLLDGVAHWIAWRAAVRGIPLVHRHDGDIGTGVFGHADVNAAWHKSTHTDPGPNFPWATVMAKAANISQTPPASTPWFTRDLGRGMTGGDVRHVQHSLKVPLSNVFDTPTERAVRAERIRRHLSLSPGNIVDLALAKTLKG